MITKLFSPFYYQSKLTGHSDYKKNLLPKVLEEYSKFTGSNTEGQWGCDCFTTFFDRDLVTYKPLEEELNFVVRQMFEELQMQPHAFAVEQTWFNAYREKQYQEVHCHTGASFSGVYYLQFDPTVHKATTFMNPIRWGESKRHSKFWYPELWSTQSLYHHYDEPTVDEGSVVIFPSELDHYVQPFFNSPSIRVTCSFNVHTYSQQEAGFLSGMFGKSE